MTWGRMGNGDSGGPGVIRKIQEWLPKGNTLDAETFHRRHLFICWVLGLHLPALFLFGVVQGYSVATAALEMITPTACLALALTVRNRRTASFFATAGLVFCSSVLVHFSGGMIEAHFHFFILIGIIALYQDWVPFAWNAVFTTLSHGLASGMSPDSMFNHYAGQNKPWLWATIHGVSVLAGCVGVVVFWKSNETVQIRNSKLLVDLGASEIAAAQAESRQRQTMSDLLVNLARRNQSLLNRQLSLIAELEGREREPEALADLFQLDHLATRIRRNAESLLVLSGDDPPRLWGRPMPLSEVVRAAAAEVEDYGRVDVMVSDHIEVTGRAVADLAHLLAELIENATTFSPPGSEVRVRSHVSPNSWSSFVLSIEDTGIGMSDADLVSANAMLVEPREVDMRRSTLGFHVVSRLAKRYGIDVKVASTPGGGLTALVTLPNEMVAEKGSEAAAAAAGLPAPAMRTAPEPAGLPAGNPPALPTRTPAIPPAAAANGAPPAAPLRSVPGPVIPPTPAAPAPHSAPPLVHRTPPVAPLAASLSGPPVAPAAPAGTPGTLTPGDVGALAAFRSPAPPSPPVPPAPVPAPAAPSGERVPGAIWPSTLSSSDALPVATPPSALAPMAPPEPAPPAEPRPPVAEGPPLAPGVTPTPPLLARGGNLFERSMPTSPGARPRQVDPFGPADGDDTPVPSLTRPFVPPPRVLPSDDEFLPSLGIARPTAPAADEGPSGDEAAADVEAKAPAPAPADGEGDDRTEAATPVEVDDEAVEVVGGSEPIAAGEPGDAADVPEAEAEAAGDDKAAMAVADPDGDVDLATGTDREVAAARLGDGNGHGPQGPRDALDTGTLAIIQGLDDDADRDAATNGTSGGADGPRADEPVAPAATSATNGTEGGEPGESQDDDDRPAPPAVTADGLVRRVPGAGLAPALRRDPSKTVTGDSRDASADQRPADSLDREAVRSMLSQFQASQRAGRALADSPVDLRPPEEDT